MPDPAFLPPQFPPFVHPRGEAIALNIDRGWQSRPELRELELLREQVNVELTQARNDLLPTVDAYLTTSKDLGWPTSPKKDKTPTELEAGAFFEMPLQRREARGRITAAEGKLAQLTAKLQFTRDKIAAQIKDALSALATAAERIDQAREYVRLSAELADVERRKFELGDSNILLVNIREASAAEARLIENAALADYFMALAALRAAVAADPLGPDLLAPEPMVVVDPAPAAAP